MDVTGEEIRKEILTWAVELFETLERREVESTCQTAKAESREWRFIQADSIQLHSWYRVIKGILGREKLGWLSNVTKDDWKNKNEIWLI